MKNKQGESKQERQQYWQGHIKSWRQSGLSQAEYCRQNLLGIKIFGYWKRKNVRGASVPVNFFPLVPAQALSTPCSDPAPLLLTLQEKRFTIEVGETFSSSLLRKLVTSLEEL